MGFADLKSDAEGAFANAASLFGFGDSTPYPEKYAYVTNTIKENDKSWRKSVGYGFRVVRVSAGGSAKPAEGWKDFILQINPESLTQDEIFAIQVTPTFSGVLVEHQGTTLKDINISGTTGNSPMRTGPSGAFPQSGRPVFATGRAGYTEFHEFRNYIRAYVEQKRDDPDATMGELRLVWDNLRDHESLYVEPQKFQMKRSARKPFMYDYNVSLKGIGVATEQKKDLNWAEILDEVIEDTIGLIDASTKIMLGAANFITKVDQEFMTTKFLFLNAIANAMKAGGKLSTAFKNNEGITSTKSVSDLKDPGATAKQTAININKLSIKNLKKSLDVTKDNMYNDKASANIDAYNEAKGNTNTSANTAGSTNPATYDELKAMKALAKAQKALAKILSMNSSKTFDEDPNEAKDAANSVYQAAKTNQAKSAALAQLKTQQKALALAKAAGDQAAIEAANTALDETNDGINSAFGKSGVSNIIDTSTTTTKEITLESGLTIQGLAANLLGSAQKFKELAVINNLKPPYIETSAPTLKIAASAISGGVTFTADVPGVGGNGIPLVFDGIDDVDTVVDAWNTANPSNPVSHNGTGAEILIAQTVTLLGGEDTGVVDSSAKLPGVLYPGDKIKIPTSGAPTSPNGVQNVGGTAPIVKQLTQAQKNFGVDLKLNDNFDIEVAPTGDAKLIASAANVAQAIALKLLMEVGSLKAHPEIGTDLQIGEKALNTSLVADQVRRSLSADSRIDTVVFVDVTQDNNTILINMVLKLKDVDQPLAIPLTLPNAA